MLAYFGSTISTACPRISSSRLSPDTISPSPPPGLAAGAHSGATIKMYTADLDAPVSSPRFLSRSGPISLPRHAAPNTSQITDHRSRFTPSAIDVGGEGNSRARLTARGAGSRPSASTLSRRSRTLERRPAATDRCSDSTLSANSLASSDRSHPRWHHPRSRTRLAGRRTGAADEPLLLRARRDHAMIVPAIQTGCR
jgi:hypothetical protein